MTFESKVETLWQTPKRIGQTPFLYFLVITDDVGNEYRYIGKARGYSRLEEYKRNMRKIHLGKPRGETQKYRAVHFVLYQAIQNNWNVNIHIILPLNGYSHGERENLESQLINLLQGNLNRARTWAVEDLDKLKIEDFIDTVD